MRFRPIVLLAAAQAASLPLAAQSVDRLETLIFTGGISAERYEGNLNAVTVSLVDSVNSVSATSGELSVYGRLRLFRDDGSNLYLTFDGGLRRIAPFGFRVRDYAPGEAVGMAELAYSQSLGRWGAISTQARYRYRGVEDRPPMPLFLQPGYSAMSGSLRYWLPELQGVRFDLGFGLSDWNYESGQLLRNLDLLNREEWNAQVGMDWGVNLARSAETGSQYRAWAEYRSSDYPEQATFDPDDPFRRDRTFKSGLEWNHVTEGSRELRLGVEGILNRSNSRRPEYDAASFRGLLYTPLPLQTSLILSASITGKRYLEETEFARLVPGEEADNASVVYVEASRMLLPGIQGALRLGWTRAETDIGDEYFERYGATFFVRYIR